MKKVVFLFVLIISLSSCSSWYSAVVTNITNVELSQANFKVIKTISGEATCIDWFMLPMCPTPNLLGKAKSDMLSTADLQNGAKAIVNLRAELDARYYGVLLIKKMYVSAEVIEFID